MGTQTIHAKIAIQPGTASTEAITKGQLDTDIATAKNRSSHTGTQTMSTISDAQSFVDGRVQVIVGAAPSALDTLQELAAALGNDPNYSATVTTALNTLGTRVTTLEGSQGAGGFKTTIGDATASTFTVTHNLNSTDVLVEVVQLSNGQSVYPVVTRPSANTTALDFGTFVPANASHRVLVRAV